MNHQKVTVMYDIIHQELNELRDRNNSFLAKRIFNLYPNHHPSYQYEEIKQRLLKGVILSSFLSELKSLPPQQELEKNSIGKVAFITSADFYQGQTSEIEVEVLNRSGEVWETTEAKPMFLSYHWYDLEGNEIIFDGERTALATKVLPGCSLQQKMIVLVPDYAGELVLSLTMVHEGKYWLEDVGLKSTKVDSIIKVNAIGSIKVVDQNLEFFVGQSRSLKVSIENYSNEVFETTEINPLYISYHWYDENGSLYLFDGIRTSLHKSIMPNDNDQFFLQVTSPKEVGNYQLLITLIIEGQSWLENEGLEVNKLNIEVNKPILSLSPRSNQIYSQLNVLMKTENTL